MTRPTLTAPLFRLGRIERYVLVQQARSLAVALGIIAALIMLIDFVEISRGVGLMSICRPPASLASCC